jgi:hypothetical protein
MYGAQIVALRQYHVSQWQQAIGEMTLSAESILGLPVARANLPGLPKFVNSW